MLDWTGSETSSEKIRNQLAQKVLTVIGKVGGLFEGEVEEKDGKEEEPEELKNVMTVANTVMEIRERKGFVIKKDIQELMAKFEEAGLMWIGDGTEEERIEKWRNERKYFEGGGNNAGAKICMDAKGVGLMLEK